MTTLIEHLEEFLGPFQSGWKDADGTVWPFHIAKFSGGPIEGTNTYVTGGLSHTLLMSPDQGMTIRHELMVMARTGVGDCGIPDLLRQVAMEAILENRAYSRGEVIGPRNQLFPIESTELVAWYVSLPVYHPDEFAFYKSSYGTDCVIAWLVPITLSEAQFAFEFGWEKFEQLLCESDPDLLDFARTSVV